MLNTSMFHVKHLAADGQPLVDGEVSMSILDLGGYNHPDKIPRLDDFVVDEDLLLVRGGVSREAYYS